MKTSNVTFSGTYILPNARAASKFLAKKGAKIYGSDKLACGRYGAAVRLSDIKDLDLHINCSDKVLCATKGDEARLSAALREMNKGNANGFAKILEIAQNALDLTQKL